jgi:hypothetical protein
VKSRIFKTSLSENGGQVPIYDFPAKFVIKASQGCGYNIIAGDAAGAWFGGSCVLHRLGAVLRPKALRRPWGGLRLGEADDLFSADGRRLQRHGVSPQRARGANDRRGSPGFPGGAI